ncbi:MAG: hypothetical protein DRP50_07610 [Thermotoga sp.]|nr:MAG: hypothetical protein DRP50_07610 [Thermotoga sp.]
MTLSRHYEICVKEFEEKCVKKMILSERSESIIFSIFTKNFSKFRTSLDFFFDSFLLYQDKRNEHKGVSENRMLRYDRFKKIVGTGF